MAVKRPRSMINPPRPSKPTVTFVSNSTPAALKKMEKKLRMQGQWPISTPPPGSQPVPPKNSKGGRYQWPYPSPGGSRGGRFNLQGAASNRLRRRSS
jgi:hypothetical protein